MAAEKLVKKYASGGGGGSGGGGSGRASWVLLRNVHLVSREWLLNLEKTLHQLDSNSSAASSTSTGNQFRLFLTAEFGAAQLALPSALLRSSRVVVTDAPTGLKASLKAVLRGQSVPLQRLTSGPAERKRLYLLLAWVHAVFAERLR